MEYLLSKSMNQLQAHGHAKFYCDMWLDPARVSVAILLAAFLFHDGALQNQAFFARLCGATGAEYRPIPRCDKNWQHQNESPKVSMNFHGPITASTIIKCILWESGIDFHWSQTSHLTWRYRKVLYKILWECVGCDILRTKLPRSATTKELCIPNLLSKWYSTLTYPNQIQLSSPGYQQLGFNMKYEVLETVMSRIQR